MVRPQTKTALTAEQLKNFQAGADLFNRGAFFEAHEDWEKGWRKLPLPDRPLVQAAILLCGVFVLIEKKRLEPAARLAKLGIERFAEAAAATKIFGYPPVLLVPGGEERLIDVFARLKLGETDTVLLGSIKTGLRAVVIKRG